MISVNNVSELADLAEACYIHFNWTSGSVLTGIDLKSQLVSIGGWSEARSQEFTSEWKVVAYQPNTDSGFSGTVFERINPSEGEPQFVVALRQISFRKPMQI